MALNSWFGAWAPYNLTQSINPLDVTWNPSGQYGFINVSMKTSAPQLERNIIENVASYGKQLGRLNEALSVVLRHIDLTPMTVADSKAIKDFQSLVSRIAAVKENHAEAAEEDIERLIDGLEYLKTHDDLAYRHVTRRLRAALSAQE